MTAHGFRPMKATFEEIRTIDLDADLTQPSQEAPGFRRLYLKLSEEPSPEWGDPAKRFQAKFYEK